MSSLLSEGGMSAPAWAFFTTIVITLGGIWIETHKTKNRAKDAKDAAETTVEQTLPIANGFTTTLRDDVAELKRLVMLTMDAQLEVRRDVGSVSRRLDAHIAESRREVK